MAISVCPNCRTKVELGKDPILGQLFTCSSCRSELELVWLDPPELDWPWEYPEDEELIYEDMDFE
jgi:lysine biosynthesis protein LysW